MLFLNDTVSLQNSKIVSKIFSQHARDGITSYLNLFGDLYYGHLQPGVFLDRYNGLVAEFINRLVNNGADVAHNLCMIELTQREPWRWPAPLTELSTGLLWSAGNSRTVATGLTHTEPWTKLPVLILLQRGSNPYRYLANYTTIVTDEQLHTALGLTYKEDGDYYYPEMELQATLADDNGRPAMTLKYIGNKQAEQNYDSLGQTKLLAFKKWQARYGSKPSLYVYTQYPDQITSNHWKLIPAGPVPDQDLIYKPAHLERVIQGLKVQHDHALYVVTDRKINADELLPWMDVDHTIFIDKNWEFALHRNDSVYKNKFISIAQQYLKY